MPIEISGTQDSRYKRTRSLGNIESRVEKLKNFPFGQIVARSYGQDTEG